jgi:NitT/TauT family transport system permease protein
LQDGVNEKDGRAVSGRSGSRFGSRLGRLRGLLLPVVLLAVWEACARAGLVSAIVLPAPSAVARRWLAALLPAEAHDPAAGSRLAWLFSGELVADAGSSLFRVVVGFLLGTALALPLGLVMGASARVHGLVNPLLQVLRPIPPIAYIPLAILWFGLGNPPAVFLIALGAFFPVLMNTMAGVRQVDDIYIRAARNLGAGRGTLFRRVMIPAAMPFILAGMRIGVGTAFIVVIVSEMIAVNDGLGYRILEAREFMWSDKIIAGMLTIGLLGLAIDAGMSRLNRYLLRWHRGSEGG